MVSRSRLYCWGVVANVIVVLLTGVCVVPVGDAAGKDVNLGVTYVEDTAGTFKRWQALGGYLSKVMNASVKVVPLNFDATVQWLEGGRLQMVLTNPLIFFLMKEKAQLSAMVIMAFKVRGESVDRYGSVVFVKAESPINAVSELGGKSVAIASKNSLGGGLGGLAMVEQEGVKVESLTLKELKEQDKVVLAVLNGATDAGIVRTGILEEMVAKQRLEMKDIKVLHRIEDAYPYVHSTHLWPEWVLAVRPEITPQEREQCKKALLSIPSNDEVLTSAGLNGFKDTGDMFATVSPFFDTVLKLYHKIKQ